MNGKNFLWAAVLLTVTVFCASGCGRSGPKTHQVAGRVEVANGDVARLVGSAVEASLETDSTVRGFGEIQPDGRFRLQTLVNGSLRKGVPEGTYKVRIVPIDEDNQTRQRAARAVAPKYLQFETSDLAIEVPRKGEVVLSVSGR